MSRERLRRLVETADTPAAARREVRKLMREAINGEHVLLAIVDILDSLVDGQEARGGEAVPLDGERISALGKALDGHFKLLNKVLPDLKSVELTGSDGGPLQVMGRQVSDIELAARLLWHLRKQGTTVEGEVEAEEPPGERSLDFLD